MGVHIGLGIGLGIGIGTGMGIGIGIAHRLLGIGMGIRMGIGMGVGLGIGLGTGIGIGIGIGIDIGIGIEYWPTLRLGLDPGFSWLGPRVLWLGQVGSCRVSVSCGGPAPPHARRLIHGPPHDSDCIVCCS